jgi:hypothetical protein
MPNTKPPVSRPSILSDYMARARAAAYCNVGFYSGYPIDERDLLVLQQRELHHHLDRVARVARRIGRQVIEPAVRALERARHVGEHRAVSGQRDRDVERCDPLEDRALLGEARLAVELGEDHAETLLPQRVGADQQPRVAAVQHQRLRVVARGDGIELEIADLDCLTRQRGSDNAKSRRISSTINFDRP